MVGLFSEALSVSLHAVRLLHYAAAGYGVKLNYMLQCTLHTANRMVFFPTEGGVSRVENRHQLVGKRYNSNRSQNGQDPFCCHEVLHWIQSSRCVSKRQMDTLIRLTHSYQVQVNKCTPIIRQSTSFVGKKTLLKIIMWLFPKMFLHMH